MRQAFKTGGFSILMGFLLSVGVCSQVFSAPAKSTTAQQVNESAKTDTVTTKQVSNVTDTISSPQDGAQSATVVPQPANDPYESFNRAMYSFNDFLDRHFLKPFAKVYNAILPKFLNDGIHHVFMNINELPILANDILQLNFQDTANDSWRFLLNSTVGILGFFDVASHMQLQYHYNDFGLTLAHYGYTDSAYLVLPFFGPNTIRDGIGIPVDYYGFSIYPRIHSWKARYGLYAWAVVDKRANLLQFESVANEVAVDRYAFLRDAYLQRRAYLISHENEMRYNEEKPVATAGG